MSKRVNDEEGLSIVGVYATKVVRVTNASIKHH